MSDESFAFAHNSRPGRVIFQSGDDKIDVMETIKRAMELLENINDLLIDAKEKRDYKY